MTDAGGAVVEILATNAFSAPSKKDLDAWIKTYQLPVTTVRDVDNPAKRTIDALERREIAYIVDLSTMRIVRRIDGSVAGIGDSAVKTVITDILVLLGKKGG